MAENNILKEVERVDLNNPDPDVIEATAELIAQTTKAITELAGTISEILGPMISTVIGVVKEVWNSVMAIGSSQRVVWLAEHAKKERTRKKNRNRIRKTFLRLMKQMGGGSE